MEKSNLISDAQFKQAQTAISNSVKTLVESRGSKQYGVTPIEIGDTFTFTSKNGILIDANSFSVERNGEKQEFKSIIINCEGDRETLNLSTFLGVDRQSYFTLEPSDTVNEHVGIVGKATELHKVVDYDTKVVYKPESRKESEMLPILAALYEGRTFEVIAESFVPDRFGGRKYYQFAEVINEAPKTGDRGSRRNR